VDRPTSEAALQRERSPSRRNIPQQTSDILNLHAPTEPQSPRRVRGAAPVPDANGGAKTERASIKGRAGLAPPSQVWFMNPAFRRATSPQGRPSSASSAQTALSRAASPPPRMPSSSSNSTNVASMAAAGKPNPPMALARASSPPPRPAIATVAAGLRSGSSTVSVRASGPPSSSSATSTTSTQSTPRFRVSRIPVLSPTAASSA
jgi:hypothetical protein